MTCVHVWCVFCPPSTDMSYFDSKCWVNFVLCFEFVWFIRQKSIVKPGNKGHIHLIHAHKVIIHCRLFPYNTNPVNTYNDGSPPNCRFLFEVRPIYKHWAQLCLQSSCIDNSAGVPFSCRFYLSVIREIHQRSLLYILPIWQRTLLV